MHTSSASSAIVNVKEQSPDTTPIENEKDEYFGIKGNKSHIVTNIYLSLE